MLFWFLRSTYFQNNYLSQKKKIQENYFYNYINLIYATTPFFYKLHGFISNLNTWTEVLLKINFFITFICKQILLL